MKINARPAIVPILLAFIAAMYSFEFQQRYFAPHLVYLNAEMMTPVVKPGEPIRARHTFIRTTFCQTDVEFYILDDKTREVVFRLRVPGNASGPGRSDRINTLHIPTLPESEYELQVYAFANCPAVPKSSIAPPIHFAVRN